MDVIGIDDACGAGSCVGLYTSNTMAMFTKILDMPKILTPSDAIKGAGYKRVALVPDGTLSGATTGPCIGHVEMEAYNGGAIGAIKDASEGQKKDHTRRKGDEKNVSIS